MFWEELGYFFVAHPVESVVTSWEGYSVKPHSYWCSLLCSQWNEILLQRRENNTFIMQKIGTCLKPTYVTRSRLTHTGTCNCYTHLLVQYSGSQPMFREPLGACKIFQWVGGKILAMAYFGHRNLPDKMISNLVSFTRAYFSEQSTLFLCRWLVNLLCLIFRVFLILFL
jgi:hypothetical protein